MPNAWQLVIISCYNIAHGFNFFFIAIIDQHMPRLFLTHSKPHNFPNANSHWRGESIADITEMEIFSLSLSAFHSKKKKKYFCGKISHCLLFVAGSNSAKKSEDPTIEMIIIIITIERVSCYSKIDFLNTLFKLHAHYSATTAIASGSFWVIEFNWSSLLFQLWL